MVLRYWPIHLGGIMRMHDHYLGECPNCERVWFKEQMSLPISPQMTDEEIDRIAEAIQLAFRRLQNQ
jgi:dTDP-4-amino-4,6-dideoxygalactose transaminase